MGILTDLQASRSPYKKTLLFIQILHIWRTCHSPTSEWLLCNKEYVDKYSIPRRTSEVFLSCDDSVTSRGMRILYSPLPGDERIVSGIKFYFVLMNVGCLWKGESGAVCLGSLFSIMTNDKYQDVRQRLGLDADSRVLMVSTEGDTDPEGFFDSIWA